MRRNCYLFHNWVWPWKIVWDEDKCITGYYYKQCAEPGCQKVRIVYNGEKKPTKG